MLNQDVGVRAVHAIVNDIFFRHAKAWDLDQWQFDVANRMETTEEDIGEAIISLGETRIHRYLMLTASAMAGFDWRSLDGPSARSSDGEVPKRDYRGSGGYTLLRPDVLR